MKQPDLTFVLRGCFFVFKEKIKKKLKGSYSIYKIQRADRTRG